MQDENAMLEKAEKFMSDLQAKKICLDKNTTIEVLTTHVNSIIDCKKVASPRSNLVINQLLHMSEKMQKSSSHTPSSCHVGGKESPPRAEKCDYSHSYKHGAEGDPEQDSAWNIMCNTNIKYCDIKGCDEAISKISESIIIPMKYPIIFKKSRGRQSSGVLLYGPPGTGKSMIARATACEISATFYTASCAELTSRWVGGSEKRLQSLFKTATANSPSIVFLDEIDSIAGTRGHESTIADQRLTNQLLIELDEINTRQTPVFVMAATNLPWQIDDAVMRRLSRKIYIPMPTYEARLSMFQQAFQNNPEVTEQSLAIFAHAAADLSGSDIATIVSHVNFQPLHILYTCTIFAVAMQGANVRSVSVSTDQTNALHDAPLGCVHENEKDTDSNKVPIAAVADLLHDADLVNPDDGEAALTTSTDNNLTPDYVLSVKCTFAEIVETYGEEAIQVPGIDLDFVKSEIHAYTPTVSRESLSRYQSYMNQRTR